MKLIAAIALLASSAALAHGPGVEWIQYRPETAYCCSPHHGDCAPLSADDVIETEKGYWLKSSAQLFPYNSPDIHPSVNNDYWACKPKWMDGKARCLFVPAVG